MTSVTTTDSEYFESAKKANVLIPIENQYQDSESGDDDSPEELEPKFSYESRGKQSLTISGDKKKAGLVRPPNLKDVKTADNKGDGEKEGENAKEGAQNGK